MRRLRNCDSVDLNCMLSRLKGGFEPQPEKAKTVITTKSIGKVHIPSIFKDSVYS